MSTPRPTPETDAEVKDFDAPWLYYVNADFARKLERERDEAREQLEAMREAIKKGHDALTGCVDDSGELLAERGWWRDEPRCGYQARYEETKQRIEDAEAALAKLKPYILP